MGNSKNLNENQHPKKTTTLPVAAALTALAAALAPLISEASVESSLIAVQSKLVGTILPLAAICGLVFAGFSFVMGHMNARQHLVCAIIGAVVGFGAESIISLVRALVN